MKYLLIIIVTGAVLYALVIGINRNEVHECITWQAQAEQYPLFTATQWQKDQCEAHNITL